MFSDDSPSTECWASTSLYPHLKTEGGDSFYLDFQEHDLPFCGGPGPNQFASDAISSIACESTFDFHHSSHANITSQSHYHFEGSSQTDVKPNPRLEVAGLGNIGYQYESGPSSWIAPSSCASTEKSHHYFEGSSQTDVKPNPRLDVVGLGNIGYQYESDPSSWNAPPSSASTDTMSSCYLPYDHQCSYDSESPQSTGQSHYSEFINGQPCAYSSGSEDDTSHVSELTAFSYQASTEYTSMPACIVFPETLCSNYEADPLHLSRHFERCPLLKKTTVASPRVLTASKSRRRPSKQGAKLYKCLRPECDGTFTARHNLINHMNSHVGFRPHHCIDPCGQSFGTRHVLQRHQKTCQTFKLLG